MNDIYIKKLISEFKLTSSETIKNKIITLLYPYISNFPGFVKKNYDEDFQQDFLLRIVERINTILHNYSEKECKFLTYLSLVLENQYTSMIRMRSADRKFKRSELSLEYESGQLYKQLSVNESSADYKNDLPQTKDTNKISQIIYHKNPQKYLILKLNYFDFFTEEDFNLLQKTTGKSFGECLSFTEKIMKDIEIRKKRALQLEEMLGRIHRLISKYQEQLNSILNNKLLQDESIKRKLNKFRKTQNLYLAKYNASNTFPTQKLIADFLNIPHPLVSKTIFVFKEKIRNSDYNQLKGILKNV